MKDNVSIINGYLIFKEEEITINLCEYYNIYITEKEQGYCELIINDYCLTHAKYEQILKLFISLNKYIEEYKIKHSIPIFIPKNQTLEEIQRKILELQQEVIALRRK